MPPNHPVLPPRENRPKRDTPSASTDDRPRRRRAKLWGFVSVPVPEGPDRYRTAGFLLKVLAWLALVSGLLFVGAVLIATAVVFIFGLFFGSFTTIFGAFFGADPSTWPMLPGFTALILLFLLTAAVAVVLTLGAITLVNHAYLRWAYREPGALAWARGVSVAAILWNGLPLASSLAAGGTEEVTTMLTGLPIGLMLLGVGVWLLVLTFDPKVERALEAEPTPADASFQVVGRSR